jgi:hypothetical protein
MATRRGIHDGEEMIVNTADLLRIQDIETLDFMSAWDNGMNWD